MIDEDLLDEFDRRWQEVRPDGSNEPPRIDDYLPRDVSGTQQKDHLERLIAIDLEYRWRQITGELGGTEAVAETTFIAPGLEDYAGRFAAILEGVGFSEELWDEAAEIRSRFLKNGAGELPELPGYRILAVLGQGGKGVVYKAEQISLNRIVALKTIREPWSGSPIEIARLRNEALTLASLNHPNLVTAYAFEHAHGIWYLVMEYVDGTDLGSHLNNRVLPGQLAAGYLLKAAQGVQCAHEAHILHRDLKPSNILLDRRGIIRVTDFGLSRLMSPPPGGSRLTASNAVLGTPGYIAPEQAAGSQASLSPATDVYGLGATLYHMLTGRPPFVGETVLDVLSQVGQTEPVPPRQLQPGVPVALQTICLKCLEKKPDRRYATAGMLADDLHRFLQGLPIRARAVGRAERMLRWCQRNPLLASLGATSLIMLMALVYLLVAGSLQKSTALALSMQQQRQMESALGRERQWNRRARDSFARQAFLEYRENRLHNVRSLLKAVAESDSDAERNWEWHYLTSLVEDDPRDTVHVGTDRATWVTAIAVSPDGRWLAAGSGLPAYMDVRPDAPADLRVWDLQTGRLHLDLHGQVLSVAHLLFSPDGSQLFAVERNNGFVISREVFAGPSRVRRWNLDTGNELPPLLDQTRIAALHWSADRQHLLAAEVDEIGPGRLLHMEIPDAATDTPQITAYGLWQRRQDGPGFVIDAVDTAQSAALVIPTEGVCHVPPPTPVLHPVEWCGVKWRLVLSPARDDLMYCYDCSSQQLIHVIQCPPIEQVALSPSEQLVAIATNQGEIQIRDTDSWRIRLTLRGHDARIRSLVFDSTDTRLFSGDWDGRLRRWDLRNSREFREVLVSRPGSDTAAFTVRHDGQLVALTAGHPLQWQNPDGDALRATVTIPFSMAATAPGRKAAFADGGTRLYVMNQENTNAIDVWDVDTGTVVRQFTEHTLPIGHLSVHDDRLVSTAWVPVTKTERWDKPAELLVRNGDGTIVFRTQETGVRYFRAALNSDGTRLAAAVEQYGPQGISGDLVRTWDVTTGNVIDELATRSWVLGLKFFEHSNHLAAAEFDSGDLLIRDPEQQQTVLRLEGVVPQSQDLCLLDHDDRLAAVSRFDFRLINLQTGNEVLSQNLVTFASDYIFNPQLILSSDGRQLLMNQADGTIRILGDRRSGDSEPSRSPPLEKAASH